MLASNTYWPGGKGALLSYKGERIIELCIGLKFCHLVKTLHWFEMMNLKGILRSLENCFAVPPMRLRQDLGLSESSQKNNEDTGLFIEIVLKCSGVRMLTRIVDSLVGQKKPTMWSA